MILNHNTAVVETGLVWVALVDEDMPGVGDDFSRDGRQALNAAETAIDNSAGDAGIFVMRKFKDLEKVAKRPWFKYQEQLNGINGVVEFLKNGVRFDGFKNGVLQEAKGFYQFLFKSGKVTKQDAFRNMFDQLSRQLKVANGKKPEWHFAEKATMKEFEEF